jgi:hypothetical protein
MIKQDVFNSQNGAMWESILMLIFTQNVSFGKLYTWIAYLGLNDDF